VQRRRRVCWISCLQRKSKGEKIKLSFSNTTLCDVQLYNQKFIDTRDFKSLPDALIPINPGSTITIIPWRIKVLHDKIYGKEHRD
jgi:hypothetical protein